ncbi:hypothetical protein AIZ23_24565, partial [Salmonella enterica subsp. enterica serovar Typhimurium]
MLSIDDFVQVAHANHQPLIVDAAADEDLRGWVASGAEMVIYSGAKAFTAPTYGIITSLIYTSDAADELDGVDL